MIKDAFCLVARVGDSVAYAPGGAGAQDFRTGKISKITGKTVTIVGHGEKDWATNEEKTIRRGSGCFVIDVDSRNPGSVGKSNAWDSLDKHIKGIGGVAGKIREEVSADLFRDGCHSASAHHSQFIDRLAEELEVVLNDD